jgi:hypothetical protein
VSSSESGASSVSKIESPSAISSSSQTLAEDLSESQRLPTQQCFDLESNVFLYRDSNFHHVANILGTLISSLIPIGSIIVLYFVSDMPARLAVVSLFTAVFSVALSLVTSATRVEIFAATAAYVFSLCLNR